MLDITYFALPRIRGYRVHGWLQTKCVIALVTCITDQHFGVFPRLPKNRTHFKCSERSKMSPKCKTTTPIFMVEWPSSLKHTCRFGTPYTLGIASQSAGAVWHWSQDRHHDSVAHSLCRTVTPSALLQSHIPHSVPPLQLNKEKSYLNKSNKLTNDGALIP